MTSSHEDELAFVGTVTASVTHEVSNVLTIIDQAAGLLEDLVKAAEGGAPIDPTRLAGVHDRIRRQVERGVEILRHLNRFAHNADEPRPAVDVGPQVENLMALVRRLADRRQVEVDAVVPEQALAVATRATALQHLVFRGLEDALSAAGAHGRVRLEVEEDGDRIQIVIGGPRTQADAEDVPYAAAVATAAAACRCEVSAGETREGDPAVVLRLPRHAEPEHGGP